MHIPNEHIIPQIGYVKNRLFEPANHIYERLHQIKEIQRLSSLRHLGALSASALTGARLARWDYTVALLHYSSMMNLNGFSSGFMIGKVKFSSTIAALQCASLIWNIGHVPGTFSIEKGICRYLKRKNHQSPAEVLIWRFDEIDEVKKIINHANHLINQKDYLGVCRVLAVIKLLNICKDRDDSLYTFTIDFAAPLLLDYEPANSKQWSKLKKGFSIVRHLSYLTLDLPFSGENWSPNIPQFFKHHLETTNKDLDLLSEKVSELLSPIEKNVFDAMFHAENSRKEAAIYANLTEQKLLLAPKAAELINSWTTKSLSRDLKLGSNKIAKQIQRCATIRLRNHFSSYPENDSDIEAKLKNMGFSHPAVFKYISWNSDTLLEPDELIIDVLVERQPTTNDLGKIIDWFSSEFDETSEAKLETPFHLLKKSSIESSYIQALQRAIELTYPGITAKIIPWKLNKFGIFPDHQIADNRGSVWCCSSKIDDPISKHILRDRSKSMPPEIKEEYAELLGIKTVRNHLRKKWKDKNPRCKWLMITGSVIFYKEGKPLIEYDGGLLRIASRGGKLTWYGLETKNGRENPLKILTKKLKKLNIQSKELVQLNSKVAYAKIELA